MAGVSHPARGSSSLPRRHPSEQRSRKEQRALTQRSAPIEGRLESISNYSKLIACCRSSIFESIPLPSLSAVRFANKRHSIATVSSQGDDYPGTPDLSGNGSRYTPVSEFGLPTDPFGKYNPPLDGKPSQEPHNRNLGAVEEAQNSSQVRFYVSYIILLINHVTAGCWIERSSKE
jgi:hypothetical protein